jgi:thiamine monophosphate synthase
VPVLAVGGITVDNVGDVIRAGADGVAVIGAILDADDTVESARALRRALDEAFEV